MNVRVLLAFAAVASGAVALSALVVGLTLTLSPTAGPVGSDEGIELVVTPDASADAMLSSLTSSLAVQVVPSEADEASLAIISPSGEVNLIGLNPAHLGPLTLDASGRFVASQPNEDFSEEGREDGNELWAGPVDGEQRLLSSIGDTFSFHSSTPGMIAFIDTGQSPPSLHTANLATAPDQTQQVAALTDAINVADWSEAGILVRTSSQFGPGGLLVPLTGPHVEIGGSVHAVSDSGVVLAYDHKASTVELVDTTSQEDPIVIDLDGRLLISSNWAPQFQAFVTILYSNDNDGEAAWASLIDTTGATIAQIQLPGFTPGVAEWDNLLAFGATGRNCCSIQIWDPTTGQTGRVESNQGLIPQAATP